ncbi:uncharacterized protein LOC116239777 [Phasianus colchicus]|uniref:uncharacterized protein LOC116239777 n=1 Tax=Phasianus colchicus TaxID=9054 RepID=UPI00129EEFB1|nr:uncharacterized protein LOC116239777 [Phasianus colchicus]
MGAFGGVLVFMGDFRQDIARFGESRRSGENRGGFGTFWVISGRFGVFPEVTAGRGAVLRSHWMSRESITPSTASFYQSTPGGGPSAALCALLLIEQRVHHSKHRLFLSLYQSWRRGGTALRYAHSYWLNSESITPRTSSSFLSANPRREAAPALRCARSYWLSLSLPRSDWLSCRIPVPVGVRRKNGGGGGGGDAVEGATRGGQN